MPGGDGKGPYGGSGRGLGPGGGRRDGSGRGKGQGRPMNKKDRGFYGHMNPPKLRSNKVKIAGC